MNGDSLDIFGITESWTDSVITNDELCVTGFNLFKKDRIVREKTGGGVYYATSGTLSQNLE